MKSLKLIALVSALTVMFSILGSAKAHAEGTIFAFGDSLLDLRFVCPSEYHNASGACGNGKGLLDYLPQDAPFTFNLQNDLAVGGSGTGTFNVASLIYPPSVAVGTLTQIQNFAAAGGRIGPHDLTLVSGRNDFFQLELNPSLSGAAVAQQSLSDARLDVATLISVGANNIVYFDSQAPEAPHTPQVTAFEDDFAAGLPAALEPLESPGIRIRLFNFTGLTAEVEADPEKFGFTTGLSCQNDPGCTSGSPTANPAVGSPAFQNQHFLFDQHPTEAGYALIARYIANIDTSADAIAAQANVAAAATDSFANTLLDHASLGAIQDSARGIFVDVGYNRSSQGNYFGTGGTALGYTDNIAHTTVGYSSFVAPGVLIGGAFNYAHSDAAVESSDGTIQANSYQAGSYVDWRPGNFFVDASLAFAHHDLSVTRPGVVDSITGHPNGWTVTPNIRGGMLKDLDAVLVGPVAQFSYDHTHIDGYTEAGDPVLTQNVLATDADSFNTQFGVRVESHPGASNGITGFLQATVSHDFADGNRLIITDATFAPALQTGTVIGTAATNQTYGLFQGALSAILGPRVQAFAQGAATAFRRGGGDYAAQLGIRVAL